MSIVDIKIEDGDKIAAYREMLINACKEFRRIYWKYATLSGEERERMSSVDSKEFVKKHFNILSTYISSKKIMFAVDIYYPNGQKRFTLANAAIELSPIDYVDDDACINRISTALGIIAKDNDNPSNGAHCAVYQLKISEIYDLDLDKPNSFRTTDLSQYCDY